MRGLAAVVIVLAWAGAAHAEANPAFTRDLVFKTQDLAFKTQDLVFSVQPIAGAAQSVEGRTQPLQVKETATETRIALAADVLFDFDKAVLLPKAQDTLRNVALFIKQKGQGRPVRIEGYTDSKGSDAYNQKLSERRARSVSEWLARSEGLGAVRMTTQGFGARNPVAPNKKPDGSDDPEGRQKNRRVEIVLAK